MTRNIHFLKIAAILMAMVMSIPSKAQLVPNPNTEHKQTSNTTDLPYLLGCAGTWSTGGWAYSATNFFGRVFNLATLNTNNHDSFLIRNARFEILEAYNQGASSVSFDIKINIYRVNGTYNTTNRTLIGTKLHNMTIPSYGIVWDQVITVPVDIRVGASENIAAEIETPTFTTTQLTYVMPKTYEGGDLGVSYWHAPLCAFNQPVSMAAQWGAALASAGYGAPSLRLELNGEYFSTPDVPVFNIFKDTICAGAINIPYSVNPADHAQDYEWEYSGGGVTISGSGNSVNLSASMAATSGNLRVRSLNYYGISAWASRPIQVDSIFSINLNLNNPTVCLGDTLTLSGPSGFSSYRWEPPTGLSSLNSQETKAAPANSHSYTLVVEDVYGCKGIGSTYVSVNPGPTVFTNPLDLNVCKDSLEITLSGASTYVWAPTTGLSNPTGSTTKAFPATTTSYVITAVDNMGCVKENPVTIKVNPATNGNITRNNNILTATQTDMAGYLWYRNGMPVIPNAIFHQYNVKGPGVYKVLFTDKYGCQYFSNEIDMSDYTSVEQLDVNLIRLYPNPTNNVVNIETDFDVNFKLLSLDGKVLLNEKSSKKVDMANLANGMYYLVVEDAASLQTASFKIVKGE